MLESRWLALCALVLFFGVCTAEGRGFGPEPDVLTLQRAEQQASPDSNQIVFEMIARAQFLQRQLMTDSAAVVLNAAEAYLNRNPSQNLLYMLNTQWGLLLREIGRFDEAIARYRSIFGIIDEGDVHRHAVVNNSIATLLRETGEFLEAIAYHERSLTYRRQVQQGGELGLAVSYLNFARTFDDLNRFNQSLMKYERAMHYAGIANHERLYMETMVSFGNVLVRLGNNDAALLYYAEGLEIASRIGEVISSSIIYTALGRVHLNIGETEIARRNFDNAFNMVREIRLPWVVRIHLAYLDFLLEINDTEAASAVIATLDESIEEIGSPVQLADFNASKAYYKSLQGDHIGAALYFNRAYTQYSLIFPYRVSPEFYFRRAFNLMAINEDAGLIQAREALSYLDRYRLELAFTGDMRAEFFSVHSRYVSELALVYLRRGDAGQAFEVAERLKSRAFSEELSFSEIMAESLTQLQREDDFAQLQSRIIFLENQVLIAEDAAARDALKIQIEHEQLRREGLLGEIAQINPVLRELMNPPLISLSEAQATLQPYAAGLHIVTGERETGFLFFTAEGYHLGRVTLSQSELVDLVTGLRDNIITGMPLSALIPFLDEVTQTLIPLEILEQMSRVSNLQVSVDGVWAYLPIAALRFQDAYFIDTKTISLTPSFTASALLQQRHNQYRRNTPNALVLANPELPGGDEKEQGRSILREAQSLRPLPFSELEGRWVSEFFPGTVRLKKGAEATELVLHELDLAGFSLLHFAAHGLMDERNPRFSGIMLAGTEGNSADNTRDGFLRTTEINALRLNADLVVLSACNTGIGRILSGEGVLGLQRSFMNAGSSQVAVTLWSVEDRATSLLMRSFYQNLYAQQQQQEPSRFFRRNVRPSFNYTDALRQAQLNMMVNLQYSHPINWASFVIAGK